MTNDGPYRKAPLLRTSAEDDGAQAALSRELDSTEELLWFGRPVQGLRFKAADVLVVPLSILWTVGGTVSFYNRWRHGTPAIFPLLWIPNLVIGAYVSIGRFFLDARKRRRTVYGITTHRALLLQAGATPTLAAVDLGHPDEPRLDEQTDGSGTITFGQPLMDGERAAFERIPDASEVFSRLRDARAAMRARKANG